MPHTRRHASAANTLPVLTVGELLSYRKSRGRVGGRVLARKSDSFVIGDALGIATIAGALEGEPGDLVLFEFQKTRARIRLGRLIERRSFSDAARRAGTESSRFIEQGVGSNLVERAAAFSVARRFFSRRGFIEVDTPVLVTSPGLDLHLDPVSADGGFLTTSPEYQLKRLLAGGMPRIFEIAHVFRKGEVGPRHNPEFTMVEWYRSYESIDAIMRDTEELVRRVARTITGSVSVKSPSGTQVSLSGAFERMTVLDAFETIAGVRPDETIRLAAEDEDRYFALLVERIEPVIAERSRPVFLCDYPLSQASLARKKPADPRVSERFELYVGGVELSNGFGELTCAVEQRARLVRDQKTRAKVGKPVLPIDERFLGALEEGMPTAAGNALGFDRLIALCLGEREIARVMAFPSDRLGPYSPRA